MVSHCGLSRELGGIFPSEMVSGYQLCYYKNEENSCSFCSQVNTEPEHSHAQVGTWCCVHLAVAQYKLDMPRLPRDFTAMELRHIHYPAVKTNLSSALRTKLLLGAGLRAGITGAV